MVRREVEAGWILMTQHDHARLAGEIIRHWGNDRFASPDPYNEVVFAVEEHDCGWITWDSRPKLNPATGYPADFMEMDVEDQQEIWSRCCRMHAAKHPYASLLTALHFATLNRMNLSQAPGNSTVARLQQELEGFSAHQLSLSRFQWNHIPPKARVNLRFMQIGDVISLMLCHGWKSRRIADAPVNYSNSHTTLSVESQDGFNYILDPYPFRANPLDLRIQGIRLERKTFRSTADYRAALKKATYENLGFTLSSAGISHPNR